NEGLVLSYMADEALSAGDLARANEPYERSAEIFRRINDSWMLSMRLMGLGDVARWAGDFARARALYEESVRLSRTLGFMHELPKLDHNLGYVMFHQGEIARAAAHFQHALETYYRSWGNLHGVAECLIGLAGVALTVGEDGWAARLFGAADATLERIKMAIWPGN